MRFQTLLLSCVLFLVTSVASARDNWGFHYGNGRSRFEYNQGGHRHHHHHHYCPPRYDYYYRPYYGYGWREYQPPRPPRPGYGRGGYYGFYYNSR